MKPSRRALVLFSGGQDSTVCLAWALEHFDHVETIGFDYGQRHAVELECRKTVRERLTADFRRWAPRLRDDHLLDLSLLGQISDTALTSEREVEMTQGGLPNTFVPGRNLLFFTFAAAVAYRRGLNVLVGGMCETDFSGYPDCRNATLQTLAEAISLGMDKPFAIQTPLMWIDKAATWRMAQELGGDRLVEIIVEETVTCYEGDRTHRHDWGYGCGKCPACELRAGGYQKYKTA